MLSVSCIKMTIEQENIVDFISINNEKNYLTLTISDHLEWDEMGEKLIILQNKINTYLAYIESDEILEKYPKSKYQTIVISLVSLEEPNEEGVKFLNLVAPAIEDAGFKFEHMVTNENS